MHLTRRRLLTLLPPALGALVIAACGGEDGEEPPATEASANANSESTATGAEPTATPSATAQPAAGGSAAATLAPTPACGDDDEPTAAQTEGPYFTPDSPMRASLLETGLAGMTLVVEGYVLSTRCEPVANALLDFWQANVAGEYDNAGYTLRGHQFSGAEGRFRLETIVPGLYPGRTRHIHVKVQAQGQPVLTTQLYFPGEPGNSSDGIYHPSLEMRLDGGTAGFDFVLNV